MSDIDKLYQKRIIEEAKKPYHFEKKEEALGQIRAYNPICGDRFDLFIDDDSLHFHGFGCTISKASTSLMIRELEGKSRVESLTIVDDFLKNIDQKEEIKSEALRVFEKTDNFKGRKDCIILAWKAMKKYLEYEG